MWAHLPISNLITAQRKAALRKMDENIRQLHEEGYHVDRDRLLDERIEKVAAWEQDRHG